jgi:hypothetical protein
LTLRAPRRAQSDVVDLDRRGRVLVWRDDHAEHHPAQFRPQFGEAPRGV